ncbi:hypothetical protein ACTHQ0_25585 [Priestia megaterium]
MQFEEINASRLNGSFGKGFADGAKWTLGVIGAAAAVAGALT